MSWVGTGWVVLSALAAVGRLWLENTKKAPTSVEDKMANSEAPTTAEMALREKLIEYLSKEIETHTTTTVAFRSRAHFTVYIGPFAVLGALLFAADNIVRPSSFWVGGGVALALLGIVLSYVTMGFVSFGIDKGAREQSDRWREQIFQVAHGTGRVTLSELKVQDANRNLKRGYIWAWSAMVVGFLCTLVIAWLLTPPTPTPQAPIPVYLVQPPQPIK